MGFKKHGSPCVSVDQPNEILRNYIPVLFGCVRRMNCWQDSGSAGGKAYYFGKMERGLTKRGQTIQARSSSDYQGHLSNFGRPIARFL